MGYRRILDFGIDRQSGSIGFDFRTIYRSLQHSCRGFGANRICETAITKILPFFLGKIEGIDGERGKKNFKVIDVAKG